MPNLNRVTLIGHLGNDPEIKTVSSGKSVCTFSLATTEGKADNKKTQWHRITCWEYNAEKAKDMLKKGSAVYIEGRLGYQKYNDKDGIERTATKIVAFLVEPITRRDKQEKMQTADGQEVGEDQIPF